MFLKRLRGRKGGGGEQGVLNFPRSVAITPGVETIRLLK